VPIDVVSLFDASGILGVSVERVRQLVVAGDLPGQRFGNAWAVPRDALVARRHSSRPGGRPLGPSRAWREILANEVDLGRPGRYRGRAEVVRCEIGRADVEALSRLFGALASGVRAAIEYGAPVVASDDFDVYLSRSAMDEIDSRTAVVRDQFGPHRLRVVDDDTWAIIPAGALAPRGAVALDLLDSADPRQWIAAEQMTANR
jgi:hypothetical protein